MEAGPFKRRAVRAWSKSLWAGTLRALGLLALAKAWVRRKGVLVLTFHRVLTPDELKGTSSLAGMIVRQRTFDQLLAYASRDCQVVDLLHEPTWQPSLKLKVAITFDDGWSDNASNAYPVAHKHGIPFTVFIVPERTGEALPFWPERAASVMSREENIHHPKAVENVIESLKGLPAEERKLRIDSMVASPAKVAAGLAVDRTMSWEEIAELRKHGVVFGSHTSTHEILTSLEPREAEREIVDSRQLIEHHLNTGCSLFSYPNGNCSAEVREIVARAGYRLAFLNQEAGVWTPESDRFQIPRVNVCEYHLVGAKGEFSPLILDYAVVWKAARGHWVSALGAFLAKMVRRSRGAWDALTLGTRRNDVA